MKKVLTNGMSVDIIANVLWKKYKITGCGSAWLERLVWDQEVAGSNPVTPTSGYISVMQECRNWQTSKTKDLVSNALVWVQVPSPALKELEAFAIKVFGFFIKAHWSSG